MDLADLFSELLVPSDDEDEGGVGDDDEHSQDVHQEVSPVPVVLVNTLRLKTQSGVGDIHVSDMRACDGSCDHIVSFCSVVK